MKSKILGKIVSFLIPGNLLLGTRLGDWYEKNSYHKYEKGDILVLKDRCIYGYGIRPVAVIDDYRMKKDSQEGKYHLTMHADADGDFEAWMKGNEVPQGVKRETCTGEIHFKWNIENQFKKIRVKNVDEALSHY